MTLKPFIKQVNFTHIMPTRYNLDLSDELSKLVPEDWQDNAKAVKGECKKKLEERYKDLNKLKDTKNGANAVYFFRKLKFCALWAAARARARPRARRSPPPLRPRAPPPPPRPAGAPLGSVTHFFYRPPRARLPLPA